MGFIVKGNINTPLFMRLSKDYYIFNYKIFVNSEDHRTIIEMIKEGEINSVKVYNSPSVPDVLNPFTLITLVYYGVDTSGVKILKNYEYLLNLTTRDYIEKFFINSVNHFCTVFVLVKLDSVYHILFSHMPYIEKIALKNAYSDGIVKFKDSVIKLYDSNFITVSSPIELMEYLEYSSLVVNDKVIVEDVNAPYRTWFTYAGGIGVYNTFNDESKTLIQIPAFKHKPTCSDYTGEDLRGYNNGFTLVKLNKLFLVSDSGVECFNVSDWSFLKNLSHNVKKRLFHSGVSRDLRFLKYLPNISII